MNLLNRLRRWLIDTSDLPDTDRITRQEQSADVRARQQQQRAVRLLEAWGDQKPVADVLRAIPPPWKLYDEDDGREGTRT